MCTFLERALSNRYDASKVKSFESCIVKLLLYYTLLREPEFERTDYYASAYRPLLREDSTKRGELGPILVEFITHFH